MNFTYVRCPSCPSHKQWKQWADLKVGADWRAQCDNGHEFYIRSEDQCKLSNLAGYKCDESLTRKKPGHIPQFPADIEFKCPVCDGRFFADKSFVTKREKKPATQDAAPADTANDAKALPCPKCEARAKLQTAPHSTPTPSSLVTNWKRFGPSPELSVKARYNIQEVMEHLDKTQPSAGDPASTAGVSANASVDCSQAQCDPSGKPSQPQSADEIGKPLGVEDDDSLIKVIVNGRLIQARVDETIAEKELEQLQMKFEELERNLQDASVSLFQLAKAFRRMLKQGGTDLQGK